MKRPVLIALWILALLGSACASGIAAGTVQPQTGSVTSIIPSEVVPTAIPITATYEGCAYVWGSQDLPEASRQFNAKLQELGNGTEVTGLAYAYGENCVYADGHQTFAAMETDFRVGVTVTTVRDEGTLGEWIAKVMPIVLGLPKDQLQGPQTGKVDFHFKQPDPGDLYVTVPIDKYVKEADSLHGAALLHLFYSSP
jgi:hypothetical protein